MTSANVPRLELERTIVLGAPVTGLSVDRAEPRLTVYFEGGAAETVDLFTGAREQLILKFAEGMSPPQRTVRIADLVATVEETVIVIHRNNREIHRLVGHTSSVTSLAVCPAASQPLLVSGSSGGAVRLWDPRTGKLLKRSEPSRVSVLITYLGPDGRARIASGDRTGRLHIWNPLQPPPHRIGSVSTRGFNDHVAPADLLDRGTLVEALRDVLRPGDDDGPTVITVEGAWGSGKSTLLELVRNRLSTPPTSVKPMRGFTVRQADWMLRRPPTGMKPPEQRPTKVNPMIIPLVVPFNPWRHQSSEQVWAGLARAVTEASESAIMPHPNNRERYWFSRNAGRVDRRHLQRQLWRRVFSPLLSFAGLGFGLSALGALSKLNVSWVWWPLAGLAAAGVVHTVCRYLFAKAAAFLPGELFVGPVTSTVFSSSTGDSLIRDPYYNARSGYLYLVQHDIKTLLKDLEAHRYRLILLIDDLDRCTPRTTAQVFEAINVFLSEDFPTTRFVLGLDTKVVASHVDHAYRELADAKIVTHPDDPSPGWTFLRKLVQLPVRLPRATEDNVDQVLLAQLGPVHREGQVVEASAAPAAESAMFGEVSTAEEIEQIVIAIEQHPEVREHLRRRLRAQPEQSVREEKRLLNVWQFYLRVLYTEDVEQAGHLVAVAEIATRWPAYLHRLRGGWHDVAEAFDDDVRWGATIARLGYGYDDRRAAANLRLLLWRAGCSEREKALRGALVALNPQGKLSSAATYSPTP